MADGAGDDGGGGGDAQSKMSKKIAQLTKVCDAGRVSRSRSEFAGTPWDCDGLLSTVWCCGWSWAH